MEQAVRYIQSELQGLYPDTEIKSFTYLMLEKLTGFSRTEQIINKSTIFSDEIRQQIESFIIKLQNFEPIQYILGETEFYGLIFNVNPSVLIPRHETEELVDWICNEHEPNSRIQILDIGTGSGCIAVSLKHLFSQSTVYAFDISETALETAQKNAKLNRVQVQFSRFDILHAPLLDFRWDVIVSNPPYVLEKEKDEMQSNVVDYEPDIALFVPNDDPLLFYRHIAAFAQVHLNSGGELYFEINRSTGISVAEMLTGIGFHNVELRPDISGNDRMIRCIV
jgi:release factor glutamine methyltransferase